MMTENTQYYGTVESQINVHSVWRRQRKIDHYPAPKHRFLYIFYVFETQSCCHWQDLVKRNPMSLTLRETVAVHRSLHRGRRVVVGFINLLIT